MYIYIKSEVCLCLSPSAFKLDKHHYILFYVGISLIWFTTYAVL